MYKVVKGIRYSGFLPKPKEKNKIWTILNTKQSQENYSIQMALQPQTDLQPTQTMAMSIFYAVNCIRNSET